MEISYFTWTGLGQEFEFDYWVFERGTPFDFYPSPTTPYPHPPPVLKRFLNVGMHSVLLKGLDNGTSATVRIFIEW